MNEIALFALAAAVLTTHATAADDLLPELAPYKGPSRTDIDASTAKGKVLCGYQGWFRAPGDGVSDRWGHWSGATTVTAANLTFEMWPDMTDYPAPERFPVQGLKHKDGSQAYLFSSVRPAVVDLHFKWMREYGIDGVCVQRFLPDPPDPNSLHHTGVLAYARNAANRTGRVFCVEYDMSGTPTDKLFDMITSDWKFLVDRMQITLDKRYLHERGKPVLVVYGFFPDRFGPEVANKIIDFFKDDPRYGVFLVGAGAWWWRSITDKGWPEVYRRFGMYSPWNVGNTMQSADGKLQMATTNYWSDDMKEAKKSGMMYLPVIYPGFSWDNLMRAYNQPQNVGHPISRRGGEFLWEQFVTATELKPDALFVAMFDEVDEGTAIFKVTNDPPVGPHFVTFEGKPSDWYLRLVGLGTKMFRGAIPRTFVRHPIVVTITSHTRTGPASYPRPSRDRHPPRSTCAPSRPAPAAWSPPSSGRS